MKQLLCFFLLVFVSCQNSFRKQTVGIQPYGNFPKATADTIARLIQDFYGVSTVVLPLQAHALEAFVTIKSPRYRADKIIKLQENQLSGSLNYIVGLTDNDISTTKKVSGKVKSPASKYEDWGVMGLAYCPGKSCVVSSFRIRHPDRVVYFSRLKKIAVHEFGHNLGLPHCSDTACVMTDAVESVATVDGANLKLCHACQLKLR